MKKNAVCTVLVSTVIAFQIGCSPAEDASPQASAMPESNNRPNVLLIVADDLGFSDLGAFGGEIDTPNLDALAMTGIRFTSFYTAPTCSPTRSMLMTGKDSHSVGLGAMAEALNTYPALKGHPGYEGYLDTSTTTIAEAFSAANYRTMMTGKWHLGKTPQHQPNIHGFDRSFALSQGGGDFYGEGQHGGPALQPVTYFEDGQLTTYPAGKYATDFYAERLIEYLTPEEGDDRPFFAYLAFTAPHWPLQAPEDLIAKYEGRYDAGPNALRSARLGRMKELDLLDDEAFAAKQVPLDDWDALPAEQRAVSARKMEIYAAMVDSLDLNVGKVLDHLRETGELENTIIIFMSDNGAEGIEERPLIGRTSNSTNPAHKTDVLAIIRASNTDLDKMGSSDSFLTYGGQWARAAMAPFKNYKGATEEGGIRSPAIVTGPGVEGGRIVNGVVSVRDIMPTVLEISGLPQKAEEAVVTIDGDLIAPSGKSFAPILTGAAETVRTDKDALAWELFYKSAVRLGDWKAVFSRDDRGRHNDPDQKWSWKLYNVKSDPGERANVLSDNPEEFARLMRVWDAYVEENGVVRRGERAPE